MLHILHTEAVCLSVCLSVCRLTFSSFSTLVLAFTIRRMLAKVLKNLLDAPILLHHTQAHSPPSSPLLLLTCTLHTLSKQANSIAPLQAHDNNSSKHTNQKQTNKQTKNPQNQDRENEAQPNPSLLKTNKNSTLRKRIPDKMIRAATQGSPNTDSSSSSRTMRLKLISEQKPPQLKLQERTQLQQRLKTPQSAQPKLQVLQSGQPELNSTSYKCNNPTPKHLQSKLKALAKWYKSPTSKRTTQVLQSGQPKLNSTSYKCNNANQKQTQRPKHIQPKLKPPIVDTSKLQALSKWYKSPSSAQAPKIVQHQLQTPKSTTPSFKL